jgi:hypothetical protein
MNESFPEWIRRTFGDPEQLPKLLPIFNVAWQYGGNPLFVWWAIDICAKYKHELPQWVLDYLAGCAERMVSREARKSAELRDILPRVLGFPARPGRGHHPLRPDNNAEYETAAYVFAEAIDEGVKPSTALQKAANALPRGLLEIDEKTLRRRIMKQFGVTSAPRTNADWKLALRAFRLEQPLYRFYEDRDVPVGSVKKKTRKLLSKKTGHKPAGFRRAILKNYFMLL